MESPLAFSRRTFIRGVFVGLPTLLLAPRQLLSAGTEGDPANPCTPTEPLEMGPYHRDGAPWRSALCGAEEKGRALAVKGQVWGADTCAPLPDAVVDVWQADAAGLYDFQDIPQPTTPAGHRMRGQMSCDRDGSYEFTSVIPGNYGVSQTQMRAKVGLRRLIDLGCLSPERARAISQALEAREAAPHTLMITPAVLEIIAVRH